MAKTKRHPKPNRRQWLTGLVALLVAGAVVAVAYASNHKEAGTAEVKGKIHITTKPTGATLTLDDKELDKKSDTTVDAIVGKHTLKLHLDNYDDQTVDVEVREGEAAEISHVFTRNGLTVVNPKASGAAQNTYAAEQLRTYHSDKYGYEIRYPLGWSVDTDQTGVAHFYDPANTAKARANPGAEVEESMAILVEDNPKQLGPEAWYKSREEYKAEDQSQIKQRALTVNGQPAYRYDTPYGFVAYLATVLTKGPHAFILQTKSGAPDREIYAQLVDTFKLP